MRNVNRTDEMRRIPEKVAVLGAAKSGLASVKFLMDLGVSVLLSDVCDREKLDFILASNGITAIDSEAGGHSKKVLDCGLIILSPGIPSDIPILEQAKKRDIPIWSEIELAFRFSKAPFIAVTGSTGKSTTVSLLGEIFTAAGIKNVVAGNIGLPLISMAPSIPSDGVIIAEVSSFQLETIELFHPSIAMILNLLKNHLDRYEHEDDYYEAKRSIIKNMTDGDTLVLNADDELLMAWLQNIYDKINPVLFGVEDNADSHIYPKGDCLYIRESGVDKKLCDLSKRKIVGNHNMLNSAAAAAVALAFGIEAKFIEEGIIKFCGLPHRMEFIETIDGVEFYNDSKATTAESIAVAINSFSGNVHLIAGGKDKGGDFKAIKESVKTGVKSVCLIGEASARIAKEWEDIENVHAAESLEEALIVSREFAEDGDVVILSPGCSSFDMFSSFVERGNVFKELVREIKK